MNRQEREVRFWLIVIGTLVAGAIVGMGLAVMRMK
jgi:hypothetical protein